MLNTPHSQRSVHQVIKLCSEKIAAGGLVDKADAAGEECGDKYFDLFYDEMEPVDELCEAECQGFRFLRECLLSEKVKTFVSDAENVCRNYQETRKCINPLDLKDCPIRDRLFLAALNEDSREALYTAGCVDRPVSPTLAATESVLSTTLQLTTTTTTAETAVPEATTVQTLPQSSLLTLEGIPRGREALQTTTGSDLSPQTTTSAGRVCALGAALACVKQKHTQVDKAASSTTDVDENLVAMCLTIGGEPDNATRCFHDNTEGCLENGDLNLKAIKNMWRIAASNAHLLCLHKCKGYQQAFGCINSLREEPMSQLCRSRKAVIRCSPCQLADGMLHEMMKRRVSSHRLDICETETPCPDLLQALEILEKCARRHWINPDDVSCTEAWSVEQCLVDRGLYSLQCRKLSRVISVVLADYEHYKTLCTTTTTTTTTTTPPPTTTTATTTEASTTTSRPTTPSTTLTTTSTTVDYSGLHSIIRTKCDADNIMNRNLSDVIMATTDVIGDRAARLLQTNLGVCIKLQTFTACLGKLPDCKGLNQRHCQTALPPQLAHMLERGPRAWCARAVREAAADMALLQQVEEGEGGLPNNTMRGWNSEDTGFNCTHNGSNTIFVSSFWPCLGLVSTILLV